MHVQGSVLGKIKKWKAFVFFFGKLATSKNPKTGGVLLTFQVLLFFGGTWGWGLSGLGKGRGREERLDHAWATPWKEMLFLLSCPQFSKASLVKLLGALVCAGASGAGAPFATELNRCSCIPGAERTWQGPALLAALGPWHPPLPVCPAAWAFWG